MSSARQRGVALVKVQTFPYLYKDYGATAYSRVSPSDPMLIVHEGEHLGTSVDNIRFVPRLSGRGRRKRKESLVYTVLLMLQFLTTMTNFDSG